MKVAIVWFKKDLRLTDNETLVTAIAQNDLVVPVYCFDDAQFTTDQYGFQKTGKFRAQFLLEAVKNLDDNLRKLGSGLITLKGKPEIEISKVVAQYKATQVYAQSEVAFEEKQTENKVKTKLAKLHCELLTFSTDTLYRLEDLPFPVQDIPDTFTPFRVKVEPFSSIRATFAKPLAISTPAINSSVFPTLQQLGVDDVILDKRAAIHFVGGETEALGRLRHYFFEAHAIRKYKETRNEMVGANYSSKFSAWLAMGCISPRYIYEQLKRYELRYGANESTYWLVFELLWRDYFRFMMIKHEHKFFSLGGILNRNLPFRKHSARNFDNWRNATTGIDFVDANMTELKQTGFMSNRGRQNVASYLCHDLKVEWRLGARYFEEQLIDYDVSSNWCNWAYVAGVGNDPRKDRYFNIEKQADQYDKYKVYRTLWLRQKPKNSND